MTPQQAAVAYRNEFARLATSEEAARRALEKAREAANANRCCTIM